MRAGRAALQLDLQTPCIAVWHLSRHLYVGTLTGTFQILNTDTPRHRLYHPSICRRYRVTLSI